MITEVNISVQVKDSSGRFNQVDVLLQIKPGTTPGDILDAISRNTCEAYVIACKELGNDLTP